MKVADSVRKAIDDFELGEAEAAMLHACNAVDGTAAKVHPDLGVKARFTRLLRENYHVFGPMAAPGIDLAATRFPVAVRGPTAIGGQPDMADVIYGIHRCTHGHGDELPRGFELLEDAAHGPGLTRLSVRKGVVQLSDRVMFALLGMAVLAPVNTGQRIPDDYFLSLGTAEFTINDWWGRAADFAAIAAQLSLPHVKLDFGDWMR